MRLYLFLSVPQFWVKNTDLVHTTVNVIFGCNISCLDFYIVQSSDIHAMSGLSIAMQLAYSFELVMSKLQRS